MSGNSIRKEIRGFITQRLSSGSPVYVDWIVHEFVSTKSAIFGPDAEFYRVCAFREVGREMKSVVGKYDVDADDDEQDHIPGIGDVSRAYPIIRCGKRMIALIEDCTDLELLKRSDELQAMARGCARHARSLRRYVSSRKTRAAA